MVETSLMEKLRDVFNFALNNPAILGILLYGSHATGNPTVRSDIDICIVAPDIHVYQAWSYIVRNLGAEAEDKYDIRVFHELPLKIQGKILDEGIVIVSPDVPLLYERLFPVRKAWEDWKFKMVYCAY